MKRFRHWLAWLIAGPRELDAFKLDVIDAMSNVGRELYAMNQEIHKFRADVTNAVGARVIEDAELSARIDVLSSRVNAIENRTPMAAREGEQPAPKPVAARNWHEFQQFHENGAPK